MPKNKVFKYTLEQEGISLIVTVDNGVAGHEAIALAQSMGVDVIVRQTIIPYQKPCHAYMLLSILNIDVGITFKYLALGVELL